MTKEQIEQAANALAVNEYPILADGPIAREKERTIHNKIVRAFIAGATSPEAKAYHEGEKDEAIRELVHGIDEADTLLIRLEDTAHGKESKDIGAVRATLQKLITKYSKQ